MLGSAAMYASLFIPWFRLESWDIPLPFSLPILGDTLSIQPFGVLVATGVLLGAWVAGQFARRNDLDPVATGDLVTYAVVTGFILGYFLNGLLYERETFMEEFGLKESGLHKLIHAGFDLLGLQTFFTAGEKEVRAWVIRQGSPAPIAASAIHTDFEKGFIRAETIAYDDFVACGGEQGAKDAGKMRAEGRDYTVRDGDVFHFRFNV